jgi:hypothetical protein
MNGGTLELVMGDEANPKWGNTPENALSSESTLSGKEYGSDY